MSILPVQSLSSAISERFADVWKLLSETGLFISRLHEFAEYENQLRSWRSTLQNKRSDAATMHTVRTEIIELRKQLRLQGYDLSLARQNLIFDGFRNEASMSEGFSRLVLFFTEGDLYWFKGDENHIALAEYLEQYIYSRRSTKRTERIRERHYLWYKRQRTDLVLSGSDTETKDDFERLKARGETHSLFLLSRLKNLR